jgi:hypothetical protein
VTATIQGDLSVWGIDGLFSKLRELRTQLKVEQHETVRITIGLMIDEVIAEMDRRNLAVLEDCMRGAR